MAKKFQWKASRAIDAAILAARGLNDKQIAASMGISLSTFNRWKQDKLLFIYALKKGQSANGARFSDGSEFKEYVVGRLSPKMKKLWDAIELWAEHKDGAARVDAMLEKYGKNVRQSLWLHAYMANSFNASAACRMIGISKVTLEKWMESKVFHRLIDEMKWHRNNYYEHALVDLVSKGDPSAIIFVNRTANRDRGYGDKVDVNVTGTVKHEHSFSIDDLELPLETRKVILRAVRAYNEKKRLGSKGNDASNEAIDIESTTADNSEEDHDEPPTKDQTTEQDSDS